MRTLEDYEKWKADGGLDRLIEQVRLSSPPPTWENYLATAFAWLVIALFAIVCLTTIYRYRYFFEAVSVSVFVGISKAVRSVYRRGKSIIRQVRDRLNEEP